VLDKGEIVEFDTPANLVEKKNGYLKSMVDATGPATASYLRRVALGELSVIDAIEAGVKEDPEATLSPAATSKSKASGIIEKKDSKKKSS
jgi:hypothetical protein